jgi:Xaa-Pro aminopeptidase
LLEKHFHALSEQNMVNIEAVQDALRTNGLDGWLLADFRGSNLLARRILEIPDTQKSSRRFYYYIPAEGDPRKLVHRIEAGALDALPGEKTVYLRWQELQDGLANLVAGASRVAMEYSANNDIPYLGRVDAGTVELVRSFGVEVVSSGNLISQFEASWDDEQWALHQQATEGTTSAYDMVWKLIAERTRDGGTIGECEVQRAILDHFAKRGLTTYSPPIVGVGPHSGDPHHEPNPAADTPIGPDQLVLVDLWAKVDHPRAVYSDLTRMGYVGATVPGDYEEVFRIVASARDAAIAMVRSAFAEGRPIHGWEVDDATRGVIESAGFGAFFVHRTGHSIGQEVHGNGANIDNLETRDDRLLLRRSCFSIEPGIYQKSFGVRSEVDVFIDAAGHVHVTGGLQTQIVPILA